MLEIRELEKNQENFESKFSSFLISRNKISNEISVIVNKIINEVREDGDQALRKITKRLDDFDCPTFQVTETEINTALKSFDKELLHSFEFAFEQLLEYQTSCFNSLDLNNSNEQITRKFRVLDSVGMYVPGGKASYPSTVLMGAAPAIACGVEEISLSSPTQHGVLNPATLAAAKVTGIKKIYKLGGAQAIAALALGTEQVDKVDKIIGPGNVYVAEAKKQLFGEVGIDSIAGPSEIVILCNETSDPETVAWDLMAQAEHDSDASSILISTSEELISEVKSLIAKNIDTLSRSKIITESLVSNGLIVKIDKLSEAENLINQLIPEHLHIAFEHRFEEEENLKAGLILKGKDSAVSLSDYVLGPSHILPTNSSARFSSPLSVEDFLVSFSYVSLDRKNNPDIFDEYIKHTSNIARAEGLTAHAIAAEKRK